MLLIKCRHGTWADINESKADLKWLKKSDNDKKCIFGVATAVSPDLQLSIEKAKMLAKSELADIIKGEMNKESKQFIKELGKTETKTVVTEVETIVVNIISDTPVRGYEIFAQDVTLTKNGYYRTWIGMRLLLASTIRCLITLLNKFVDAYNLNSESQKAWEKLKKKIMTIIVYSKNNCVYCTKFQNSIKKSCEYEEKA